jgi:hypothetical protein
MRKSVLACALFVAGCGVEVMKQEIGTTNAVGLPASVVAAAEPAGAKEVADLKKTAKEGDAVVVRGVVGGDAKPIVAGRAVFTIGDVKGLALCTGEGESCPTPWDACCMDALAKADNTLTVQFLGPDGKPLAVDVEASGVKPMSTVVVAGKVGPRPSPKILVVDATSIFVVKP